MAGGGCFRGGEPITPAVASRTVPKIDSFDGDYRFLSNFYKASVVLDGSVYETVEHAYQAAKTLDPSERVKVRRCSSPGRAKKAGRQLSIRKDWEEKKLDTMRQLVLAKFLRSRKLAKALLETGEAQLVEGNNWNDTFWGVCRGKGDNHLGKILMWVRSVLSGNAMLQWGGTQKEAEEIRQVARLPEVRTVRQDRPHIAIDTETYLIIPGLLAPRMVCLTYCKEDGEAGILLREEGIRQVHEWLDAGVVLIGHNIAYDLTCLVAVDPTLMPKVMAAYDEGRIKDTYVREKLLMLAIGQLADAGDSGAKRQIKFGLDAIVKRRFNRDISEDKKDPNAWRLRYRELDGVPLEKWPKKAVSYAIDDSRWTMAAFVSQEAEAGGDVADSTPQTRAAFWLHLMGVWGVRTDPEHVFALERKVRHEFEEINKTLKEWKLLRPKMQKGQQVWSRHMAKIKAMVAQSYGGVDKTPKTEKGAISTSRDTLLSTPYPHLEGCVYDSDDDQWSCEKECLVGVLHMLGRRSGVEKLLTTFVPALMLGTQVPINPRWNELVATGRTSCMRPNLQQPPRRGGVRECFVPRPGFLYASADYSFVELCALAQVCLDLYGFSRLADAINAGLDPHLDMAAELMGVTYKQAEAIKANKKHPRNAEVKEMRQLSKALNFGLPGGLGAEKFVDYARAGYGVIIDIGRARQLKPIWQQKWPEVIRFHQDMGNRAQFGQSFTLEQLRSGRIRGDCGFCDGSNCVDFETEALTRRGWVSGNDLRLTDELLTKNIDTGKLEWQQPTHINLYPDYDGPLVEFDSKTFSAVTTPNHRWMVFNKSSGRDECVTTARLSRHGDHRIHRTGDFDQPDAPYSDDFLRLVGWVITDGFLEAAPSSRIRVHQTKPDNVKKIDALFDRLNIPVHRAVRSERGAVVWSFSNNPLIRSGVSTQVISTERPVGRNAGLSLDDYTAAGMGKEADAVVAKRLGVTLSAVGGRRRRAGIPRPVRDGKGIAGKIRNLFPDRLLTAELVGTLSRRQAEILFDTMMLGDGTRQKTTAKFYTRSESAAKAFQMLCTLIGKSSRAEWKDMSKYKQKKYPSMGNIPKMTGIWAVNIYVRDKTQIQKPQARDFSEARGVWCPTVPNGYFVARRRGGVFVTGNSLFQGLTSDGAKKAGWLIAKECYLEDPYNDGRGKTDLFGSRPVMFLHDEFILEVPREKAAAAAERLSERMIIGMREVMPDVSVFVEPALMARWFKGAESVRDENKKLIPWEPS